jgi:hypothetical protein
MRRLPYVLMTIATAWFALHPASSSAAGPLNYSAQLTGHEESPPRETNATGHATFQLSKDGLSLSYTNRGREHRQRHGGAHLTRGAARSTAPVGREAVWSPRPPAEDERAACSHRDHHEAPIYR